MITMHDQSVFLSYRSIGEAHVWSEKVYPGMTSGVVNTLLATMDIAENKKVSLGQSTGGGGGG